MYRLPYCTFHVFFYLFVMVTGRQPRGDSPGDTAVQILPKTDVPVSLSDEI